MSKESKVPVVCAAVEAQVVSLIGSDSFEEWRESTPLRQGDLIAFNNSFLFRDGISLTVKNAKYLCVQIDEHGEPSTSPMIVKPGGINLRFKRISARQADALPLVSLKENVEAELENLGVIIRALVGQIGSDEPAVVEVEKAPGWNAIKYEPDQSGVVQIQDGVISINRIDDINAVWTAIEKAISVAKLEGMGKLAVAFEGKFRELREMAYRSVDIDKVGPEGPSILSEVVERIERQIKEYRLALRSHTARKGDVESFNELLRIAYNFADGTQELLRLVIGVSDMKPALSWLTICPQSRLADQFQRLPLGIIGNEKPSIGKYRTVVAGARNRAFHDIFSFGQPFRVRLTGEAFRTPELRLFREYTSKVPALDFEDRKLVALLEGFTRTSEQTVPLGFWESNLEVMDAVADIARSLWVALLMLVSKDDPSNNAWRSASLERG